MAIGLPDACLSNNANVVLAKSDDGNTPEWDPANGHCDATYSWLQHYGRISPEHLRLDAETPHAGYLILHLRDYAAWKVNLNGHDVAFGANAAYPDLSPPRRRLDGCPGSARRGATGCGLDHNRRCGDGTSAELDVAGLHRSPLFNRAKAGCRPPSQSSEPRI